MYAADFNYYRAKSVAEAGDLLRKYPGAKLLAGGHTLIPLLKLRLAAPPALVDISRIAELKGITAKNDTVRIGAMTTHAEIAASAVVREHCAALAEAASQVGDPAVRNRGTIGGNIAHADPASDLPTVLAALGAKIEVTSGSGSRTIDAAKFFKGMMTTDLGEQDLLTAIEVPVTAKGQGSAYVKFAHPASRYAVIGVAASTSASGGKCGAAVIMLGGLVPRPTRAAAVEKAIIGQPLSAESIAKAAGQVTQDLGGDVIGDLYASADYRRAVASVWVKRALSLSASRTN